MTHFDHLLEYFPDLASKRILDLGSGRGSFLVDTAKRGVKVSGLEKSVGYIEITKARAQEAHVQVDVRQGTAENIPFNDASFDFVNICEVIEHVEDPDQLLSEVYRVLVPGGQAYLSVPNRFGFRDPHFHLYFVNWLPRKFAHRFISLFGKHKEYKGDIGKQRLDEMYYATYGQIRHLAEKHGFQVQDMRLVKISRRYKYPVSLVLIKSLYFAARFLYFDSAHLILSKPA